MVGGRGRKRDKTHYKISPCYQTQRSIHHRLSSRLMKGGALPSSTGTQTFLHTQAFLFRSLAYFSTCAHAGSACLVQNCHQESLQEFVSIPVLPMTINFAGFYSFDPSNDGVLFFMHYLVLRAQSRAFTPRCRSF